MDILQRANKRLEIANGILDELQLLQRWRKIGEPFLVGAAAYGLIVDLDIDMETFNDHLDPEKVLSTFKDLSKNPNVLEFKYRNYLHTSFNGLYFKIIYKQENNEWNIDMWLFSKDHSGPLSRDLLIPMSQRLTDHYRKTILKIKEEIKNQNKEFSSIFIYQAVMDHGVQTYDEFLSWVENRDVNQLTTWKPIVNNI